VPAAGAPRLVSLVSTQGSAMTTLKVTDVIDVGERDYMYGTGRLILRITKTGGRQRLPDGEWLDPEGLELRPDGTQIGQRPRHAPRPRDGLARAAAPAGAAMRTTTYLARSALDELDHAHAELERRLLVRPNGLSATCGQVEPCAGRRTAGTTFVRYGRIPRRRTGAAGVRRSGPNPAGAEPRSWFGMPAGGGCSTKVRSFMEGASSWQVTVLRRRLDRSAGVVVRRDRPNGTNDFGGLRAHSAGTLARGTATVAWRFARRDRASWRRGPLPPRARTVVATSHRDGVLASVLAFLRDRPTGVHL
jgi:hypothetical protein